MQSNVGLIGLAVMGQNLALNMESKGYRVTVYNRTYEKTSEFMEGPAKGRDRITAASSLEELVETLEKPRKIIVMIKAGHPVDALLGQLVPLLDEGDIIMDGGNSFFRDTMRRTAELGQMGILYLGAGISGGEEGALKGPSIMPGGNYGAWEAMKQILQDISAKVDNGVPCCDYIGPDGAGHYVKMVHNGIEYADMQLISEAYFLMSQMLGMQAPEIGEIFDKWNRGRLNSYLIEITADILGRVDEETHKPLVDVILDRAGQKGTGIWTSQEALQLGVAAPTIADAVFARAMSSMKGERVEASVVLEGPSAAFDGDRKQFIEDIGSALYASKICAYTQGFQLLKSAGKAYNWELKLGDIALLWRGGCIIRAQFLDRINDAYRQNKDLKNLLLDPYFKEAIDDTQQGWRRVVCRAAEGGIPVSSFASALSYYDSYRSDRLPANIIQAQRDFFGAHTYERTDKEGSFHTQWL